MTMKKIEAIVNPTRVQEIRSALGNIGIMGLTISAVAEFSEQQERMGIHRWKKCAGDGLPAAIIGITVPDSQTEDAVTAIVKTARMVEIGEGDAFVSTIEDVIRIRVAEMAL